MGHFRLKSGFTTNMIKGIELMALGQTTQEQIAKEIGVNPSTICKWKKDPAFLEAVIVRSREILRQQMPDVYASLAKGAKKGEAAHIRMYLEHIERLEQIRAGQASITFTWNPTTHTEEGE